MSQILSAAGRATRHAVAVSIVVFLLAASSAAPAMGAESCDSPPSGLLLDPGQQLRLNDKAYQIVAEVRRGRSSLGAESGSLQLELDLLPEYLIDGTLDARVGSYVPHLEVSYRLDYAGTLLHSGPMEFRMSHHGHTYGTAIPLDELAPTTGGEPLTLSLTLDRQFPDQGDGVDDCPTLPLSLACSVPLTDLRRHAELQESTTGVDAPATDARLTLLSNFDPDPAESSSDIWGYSDGVTQLAIMGKTSGTSFIDVSDPFNPVEVGFIGGPNSSWRDIKTYLNHAYIVTEGTGAGEGMQVVDLSDPTTPTLVNTINDTFTTAHNIYIDETAGQAWVVGASGGSRIRDLAADPIDPPELNNWDERYVHDAYVADDLAYMSEINDGLQEILDTSNIRNLQLLSSWPTPGLATHNCWANQDHTLLSTTDETGGGHVAVYDITNKTAPGVLLGEYNPVPSSIVHNVKFDDDDDERIAVSYYALGGKLVDLHRPSAPVELGSYDTFPNGDGGFNGAWGVYAFDPRGYVFISDVDTGLYVLRYDPTGGTLSGVVRDALSGNPVAGAGLVVLNDGTTAKSGADGVYAVYAPTGPLRLRVAVWGYRTRVLEAGEMPLDGRLDVDVDLERLPVVGLTGFVRRSDDASGIEGATVRIVGSDLSAMTAADGSFNFPEVAIGQQVVTAEAFGFSSGEQRVVLDAGGASSTELTLIPGRFVDDAEANRGWGLGQAGDTADSGEWERVDPNGTGGGNVQPEDDHTADPADTAFITGQSSPGASTEANDVEGGFTTLLSPTLDATGMGAAMLRYYRWLSTSAGFLGGGTLRVQVSANDGFSWTNLELSSANAASWRARQFDLGSVLGLTDQMRVRFRAEAASGFDNFRVLEVGVDDVELVQGCGARFNPANGDSDADGIANGCDACPLDSGDDADGDGICGDADNAPFDANPGQLDADADGIGDVADNCADDPNPAQRDQDGDGSGDACDSDIDNDGSSNDVDDDDDGDGVPDAADLCPETTDSAQADRDADGRGDACDPDDGVVRGLRLDGRATLVWEPEDGSDDYNVYRGDLGAEALLRLAACRVAAVPATFFVELDLPAPGDGFFYLVARRAGGVEGSLGFKSDDTERQVDSPCP